ncbi:MAG: hypothetical protein PHG00_03435 [Methylococcales bacterium]|nr:hypothetical protein [Methylococcales bacterium]
MVSNGGFTTHLETLDVAGLLDGPMVLLNMPMLVMLFCKDVPGDFPYHGLAFRQQRVWLF